MTTAIIILQVISLLFLYLAICSLGRLAKQHIDLSSYEYAVSFADNFDKIDSPYIVLKQGDKEYMFIIDTCCSVGMISADVLKELKYKVVGKPKPIIGIEGVAKKQNHLLTEFIYEDKTLPVLLTDYDCTESLKRISKDIGTQIDGVLGSCFIKSQDMVIDYKARMIYI